PRDEYEVIFVDDGSTDGTGERLDALAAEQDVVRAEHIPNSGWPGRPRNVGTDLARGEYVLDVDNDDWLGPQALEPLHAAAVADGADVVVGKVVGHGKFVARELFEANRSHVSLAWEPLVRLLSPHKLFRRAFLAEHGLRFPEGRRRLEDHVFVMRAYFAAQDRISILADYPCYHWMLRGKETNASWSRMDPAGYYANVREVLDIVEDNVPPGPERERLLAHWHRSKGLQRLDGAVFLRRDRDYNREIFDAVRALTLERFPVAIDRFLPFNLRMRAHLVRGGDLDGVYALAAFEAQLKARVRVTEVREDGCGVALALEGRLRGDGSRLLYRRDGDGRLVWHPPPDLRERLAGADLDATRSVPRGHVQPLLRSVGEQTEHVLPSAGDVRLDEGDAGLLTPVVSATARLDPAVAAVGSSLPAGEWQLVVPVRIGGFNATAMTVKTLAADGSERRRAPLTFTVTGDGRLDRPSWARRHLSGRAPRLAQAVRRAGRGARGAEGR
ncbi:MAG: glycosyltransferase family A protein, partial [Solirubrobacteraceae bacterium]